MIIARFSGRCPELSAFAPSGRVHNVCGKGKRMTNFHPFIISKQEALRPDPRWEATVWAEALRLEKVRTPSSHIEIKNAL